MKTGCLMSEFIKFNNNIHRTELITLNFEYLKWADQELKSNYNVEFFGITNDLETTINEYATKDVDKIAQYTPDKGMYLLVSIDGKCAGMGGIKEITTNIGEIKRMYIRKEFRGQGLGGDLLIKLIKIGESLNFSSIRLDSIKFMKSAQKIYKSAGFKEINSYPESEIPSHLHKYWIFMVKKLK
jgi:ribosomal protein S18 acetylase RimI-like enzyme